MIEVKLLGPYYIVNTFPANILLNLSTGQIMNMLDHLITIINSSFRFLKTYVKNLIIEWNTSKLKKLSGNSNDIFS